MFPAVDALLQMEDALREHGARPPYTVRCTEKVIAMLEEEMRKLPALDPRRARLRMLYIESYPVIEIVCDGNRNQWTHKRKI